MVGATLGHYKILEKIGAGGMGEVYRATDARLGRDVAIKILPEAFARDPERLARFDQEARLLAALNHPNIAAIYGLEETQDACPGGAGAGGAGRGRGAGRVQFLVLEFVPGETLAERVGRGAIPVEEALGLCRQLAEALEAAHERGIIHRDLKPANVKVTPEGKVKVLDFGLAKAFAPEGEAMRAASPGGGVSPGRPGSPPEAFSQSPTLTFGATRSGVILGTASYMSPEQARGKPLDKRTDIWSFGCVLYEALTGRQAFAGETVSDTIGNILNREPDWGALPRNAPAAVRRLLGRCLEKKAERRVRDIGDARIEIEDALAAPSRIGVDLLPENAGAAAAPAPGRRDTLIRLLPWGIAALLLLVLGAVAVFGPWRPGGQFDRQPRRLTITLPPEAPLALEGYGPNAVLSPDASRLVYVAKVGDKTQLYLRPLDSYEVTAIPGTEGASGPFFSPDGKWVGFFAAGKLRKVALAGGAPVSLAATTGGAASWGEDRIIVYSTWLLSGLMRVADEGGVPQALTTLGEGVSAHRMPEILPGGEAILLTSVRDWRPNLAGMNVCLLVPKTGEVRTLVEGASHARYVPGHIVYAVGNDLHSSPFDLQSLRVTGEPMVAVQRVRRNNPYTGDSQFSISSDGSLLYVPGGSAQSPGRLQWVGRSGQEEGLPLDPEPRGYNSFSLSPDGLRLAAEVDSEDGSDIWVWNVEIGTATRLTFDRLSIDPVWTPDGRRITFRNARGDISWKPADGSGPEEQVLSPEAFNWIVPTSWSPDGTTLVFGEYGGSTAWDLWLLRPGDGRKPEPFFQTPSGEARASFSPDGRWLAYTSDESGRWEVYVVSFPDRAGKWQVSTSGGGNPVWARSGRELFYYHSNQLLAAPVTTTPRFSAGKPQLLFEAPYLSFTDYDASPDGRRFIVSKPVEAKAAAPSQIQIVLHWAEELKRRAGR